MTDPIIAILGALRDTLLGISAITDLVEDRVFWEDVEDIVELPYVVIAHMVGGYENKTQNLAVDTYWKVCFVTSDKVAAIAGRQAIHELHEKSLDKTNEPNIYPYRTIREQVQIYEREVAQNVPVYTVGGIYRVSAIVHDPC
jgi:hypothetical protein